MILKYSIKNMIRSWKKSILFLALIVMLVIILCIGVSLTVTIGDFLNECEKNYTTIATFEYMGAAYPNETIFDPALDTAYDTFDSAAITSNPCVKEWDSNDVALGYIGKMPGLNSLAPFQDYAVLLVHLGPYQDSEHLYNCEITEALYSYRDEQGHKLYLDAMGNVLEAGHYYLIHVQFYFGNTAYKYGNLAPFYSKASEEAGFDGSYDKMILDVTTADGGYAIPSDNIFHEIADTYTVINNSVTVHATNNLDALLPFQQGTLYLISGRTFTKQDYTSGTQVCLISEALAKAKSIEIGDTVDLAIATQSGCTISKSYWAGEGFTYNNKYTVVGLVNTQRELKNDIFIPKSDAIDLSANHFQYKLGQAVLYNDKADQFVSEVSPLLQDRIRMTVYDQGYSSVTKPLKDVLRGAVLVTCICAIVCLAVAFLFGFLFVYRQRDVAKNMYRLGAGKRKIYGYFLFGAGCISFTAVIIGTAISIQTASWVMELVRKLAAGYAANDLRYSNGNLSMVKAIVFAPEIKYSILICTGILVFLLTVCSCYIFTGLCISSHKHKHRVNRGRSGTFSRSLHGGPLKYAWLSISRGRSRTFIPILVTAFAILLLFQLTHITENYRAKLDELNKTTDIKGYFTDINGKQTNGLSIDGIAVRDLTSCGYLSEVNVTKEEYYLYLGRVDNGQLADMSDYKPPTTDFQAESLDYKLNHGSNIIYANDLSSVPEFYFSSKITTDFLQGYDASIFSQEVNPALPYCIVSTSFMEENGIKLGDTIRLMVKDGRDYMEKDMLVVGDFVRAGIADNIYCQLGAYISPEALFNKASGDRRLNDCTFSSVHFKLKGSENLGNMKDYLDEIGYSEVKKIRQIRSFITIDDKVFLTTQSAMSQRIWYMKRIFPALYLLIELLAGLIPYILIQLRKREIAIMRGQGSSKAITFLNLFIEQAILIVMGVSVGVLVSKVLFIRYSEIGFILTGIFAFCWLSGTFVSIHQINRCSVQSILKAEE